MTYNKPEIVKLDKAAEVIQGTAKLSPMYPDAAGSHPITASTIGAYESDE